jgi:predicted O-methyltransferase YrrM
MSIAPLTHTDIKGWFDFEDLYCHMVWSTPDTPEGADFVEVGACFGKSTAFMAKQIELSGKNIRFHVVDIWENNFDKFFANMAQCGATPFVRPIRAPSELAALQFPPESLDFVFIDADHRYKAVYQDIRLWLNRVKPGGVLAGHDIHLDTVRQAVNDTLSLKSVSIWKNSWVYRLDKGRSAPIIGL